ncbi:MAG: FxDxF family PEP-CTERM protein [Methylotenera sp.]
MKKNIKHLALAAIVAAALSSVNASAANYNVGLTTAGNTYSQAFGFGAALGGPNSFGSPVTFYDTIEFELTAPAYVTVFARDLTTGFNFAQNAGVSVIDLKGADGTYYLRNPDHVTLNPDSTGSYNFFYPNAYYFPGSPQWNGSLPDLTGGLPTGKYTVNFNYGPNVTSGGFTGGVTIAAAVPEPETYAMMLAGLALIGFSARHRKAQL